MGDQNSSGSVMPLRFVLLVCMPLVFGCGKPRTVTVNSASPDGKWRALLIEFDDRSFEIDRNFEVLLEDAAVSPPQRRVLFSSPDEGRPIGTERVIWSKDSKHLVLIGKQFFVKSRSEAVAGDLLYLLVDVQPEKSRCNSHQQIKYAPFTVADLAAIEWSDSAFDQALREGLRKVQERK